MRLASFLLAAVVGAAAGCSGSASSSSGTPTGIITGILEAVRGPAPGSVLPVPGTVTIKGQYGHATRTEAGRDGNFSATVPAGRYAVTARSPRYEDGQRDCVLTPPSTIAVTTGDTTKIIINCVEK